MSGFDFCKQFDVVMYFGFVLPVKNSLVETKICEASVPVTPAPVNHASLADPAEYTPSPQKKST